MLDGHGPSGSYEPFLALLFLAGKGRAAWKAGGYGAVRVRQGASGRPVEVAVPRKKHSSGEEDDEDEPLDGDMITLYTGDETRSFGGYLYGLRPGLF